MTTICSGWITTVSLIVLAALMGWARTAALAADLPVSYQIDLNNIKKASNGTQLTFNLHPDSSCQQAPFFTQQVLIEDVMLIEELRFVKRIGGSRTRKTARIEHVLTGVDPKPVFFLDVIGAFPFTGEECQQQLLPQADQPDLPQGAIALWSGTLSDIPAGWALCDGTQGTPDLTDMFVWAVSSAIDPGNTGGGTSHHHLADHRHGFALLTGPPEQTVTSGPPFISSGRAASESHIHGQIDRSSGASVPRSTSVPNIPPFFKLAFIMKLS